MNTDFAKTILRAMRHFEKATYQLDDLIFDKAICTDTQPEVCFFNSAQRQIERIMQLMHKKNNIINLKLITDRHLARLSKVLCTVLKMRYAELKEHDEIIAHLGVSERTYFRYLENAYQNFAMKLTSSGFGEKWFKDNYFDQRWLRRIYESIAAGTRNEE